MKSVLLLCIAALVAGGCTTRGGDRGVTGDASTADGSTGDATTPPPPTPRVPPASISGTVWAPGNAPGMVPVGHEIPVSGAIVRLTTTAPEAIPGNAYCERCVDVSGVHAVAESDGTFTINGILPGDYWLSVQKGQFRIDTQVTLAEAEDRTIPDARSTLPSNNDPSSGRWVPRIAVASGTFDDIQDVLGKMSIGTVDASGNYEMTDSSASIDFYSNGGTEFSRMSGSLTDLVSDLDRMSQYHIIFIPCAGSANTDALEDQQNLRNIRDYVAMGGKLYVTDWSGEWMDNVFPSQITLQDENHDTPAAAYNAEANTWNTALFGDANGSLYSSNNAEVTDENLFDWLNGQTGPSADDPDSIITFDASHFDVVDNWNTIVATTPTQVGFDEEGLPLIDSPKAYVIGGHGTETPKLPLTVTFEPAGCGRVLYSTYHTTDEPHAGLVPQERILLYLIMEIGVCIEAPILI